METMKDFIREIRRLYNIEKDAELADLMGLTRAAISAHKSGRAKHFSQESAYRIAELLDLNPAYVLLCLEWEQSPNKSIEIIWRQLIKQVEKYAAIVLLAVFVAFSPPPAKASTFDITLTRYTLYAMLRRWFRRLLILA